MQDGHQMEIIAAVRLRRSKTCAGRRRKQLLESILRWRDDLTDVLEQMPTDAFERLILRVLGKDGVSDIDVSHTNDSIEGMGVFGGGGFSLLSRLLPLHPRRRPHQLGAGR